MGALCFFAAYAAVVVAMVRPVRVRHRDIPQFARGIANLLSAADEPDHLDLSNDLFESLPNLIQASSFLDYTGEKSAFFDFAYRRQIEQAGYANSLLQIVADPNFCKTLVSRAPWRLANAVKQIGTQRLYSKSTQGFIREISLQAIVRDDSIVARETSYRGFGAAPLLSDALFSECFIVTRFNPLEGFFFGPDHEVTAQLLDRFNRAAERCYLTLIEAGEIQHAQVAFSIQSFYRSLFARAWEYQESSAKSREILYPMMLAIDLASKLGIALLASVNSRTYESLFVNDASQYRSDVLEILVEIVHEGLSGVARGFKGADDPFWPMAMKVMTSTFSVGTQPTGLSPFQQRLLLKLSKSLNDNVNGFYPAIARVLLSVVGPYRHDASQENMTAFNVLKDVLYIHMKRFHSLAPHKVSHYLPPNVSYQRRTNSVTHTNRSGTSRVTALSTLSIRAFALTSKRLRRTLNQNEREMAKSRRLI